MSIIGDYPDWERVVQMVGGNVVDLQAVAIGAGFDSGPINVQQWAYTRFEMQVLAAGIEVEATITWANDASFAEVTEAVQANVDITSIWKETVPNMGSWMRVQLAKILDTSGLDGVTFLARPKTSMNLPAESIANMTPYATGGFVLASGGVLLDPVAVTTSGRCTLTIVTDSTKWRAQVFHDRANVFQGNAVAMSAVNGEGYKTAIGVAQRRLPQIQVVNDDAVNRTFDITVTYG